MPNGVAIAVGIAPNGLLAASGVGGVLVAAAAPNTGLAVIKILEVGIAPNGVQDEGVLVATAAPNAALNGLAVLDMLEVGVAPNGVLAPGVLEVDGGVLVAAAAPNATLNGPDMLEVGIAPNGVLAAPGGPVTVNAFFGIEVLIHDCPKTKSVRYYTKNTYKKITAPTNT